MGVLGDYSVSRGEIPKRPTGADCKSAGECLRRFESCSPHLRQEKVLHRMVKCKAEQASLDYISGSSSVGRALAFQAKGRGFEFRLPLLF